ncbi:hypothetical protein [Natrinema sp. 1APR25-10V2]|uniref:hypothetical protein n=1 Tax=Natrinema sp. 1APR25-10V2 TaxID=2951081 RepID=UPI002874BE79|nr:hypothetical protein [Natrinema sp. 1APR25-10V2]MDS0475994.1 hypothetical protein [Natrinema sp. 1APR25-10V2]
MTDDGVPIDPSTMTTATADEAADATDWSLPACPECGRPVWIVTVAGPGVGTASPCGCAVVPGGLEHE